MRAEKIFVDSASEELLRKGEKKRLKRIARVY